MEKQSLTEQDFQAAATKLRCDTAAIYAVAEVESKGRAFYADGFPTILFERHKFHKYTEGKFDASHPEISNAEAGGYGLAGQHQRDKFNLAFSLDPIAALKSCSWGKFQIMGFNYELCGFSSVGAFVDAMRSGEPAQLDAFVAFIISTGLSDELRNHKWTALAEGYNGLNQKKNNYDSKLAAAYKKFKNPAAVPAANPSVKPAVNSPSSERDENQNDSAADNSGNRNEPPTENSNAVTVNQAVPAKDEAQAKTFQEKINDAANSIKTYWFMLPTAVTAAVTGFIERLESGDTRLVFWLIGISAGIFSVSALIIVIRKELKERRIHSLEIEQEKTKRQREAQAHELTVLAAKAAMDKSMNNISFVPQPILNSDS